jgi:5-methylcytosine-specific restriction enzyme subunit McrC
MPDKSITAYEFGKLFFANHGLKDSAVKALVKYNETHGNKYFTLGIDKITFKQYVGVIQVGNKVIEVLPKADSACEENEETKRKWQAALLLMLRKAGYIKLNETESASQDTQKRNLLDIYLFEFLREVEELIHAGLVKKYKRVRDNQTSLKGRLLIEKQILFNTIHKERFYTEHTVYNRDNVYNRVLKAALEIVYNLTTNGSIKEESAELLLYFDNIHSWNGNASDFDKIKLDRKTQPYKPALELARMIVLNYCPNMKSGTKHVLALLFDMNRLFEKFIYRMLKVEESNFKAIKLNITRQNSQPFWEDKPIIPDIVIDFVKTIENEEGIRSIQSYKIIVDTKWKIVAAGNPADNDLKQMYAYNMQFGADHSILLYPHVDQKTNSKGTYKESLRSFGFSHSCEMYFIKLFEGDVISKTFSNSFISYLTATQNIKISTLP